MLHSQGIIQIMDSVKLQMGSPTEMEISFLSDLKYILSGTHNIYGPKQLVKLLQSASRNYRKYKDHNERLMKLVTMAFAEYNLNNERNRPEDTRSKDKKRYESDEEVEEETEEDSEETTEEIEEEDEEEEESDEDLDEDSDE